MRQWRSVAIALLLLLALVPPVLADGGEGGRVVFGEGYTLRSGEWLNGDLVVFGGDVVVEEGAEVRGDVVAFGGAVQIAGQVEGDVTAFGGQVTLTRTAAVAGELVTIGGALDDQRVGQSGGQKQREASPQQPVTRPVWPWPTAGAQGWRDGWRWGLGLLTRAIVWCGQTALMVLTVAIMSALLMVMAPGLAETASRALTTRPVESAGAGLLAVAAAALLVPLLAITCLGLPLAAVLLLGLALAGLFGWVVTGLTVGSRCLAALHAGEPRPVVAAVVGASALTIMARLPGLGALLGLLLGAWGLGAVALTRFGTTPYTGSWLHSTEPAPAPALEQPDADQAGE